MRSFIQLTAMSARNSNTQSPMNNLILCHVLAVMLEYAVLLPCVLPVDLSLVHAITSYTGVCAVVINRVILRCFSAGPAKNQKWGNYKHCEK